MAYNVRIFAHRGLKQMLNRLPTQFSSDSVFQLEQPYEWSQLLVAGPVAVSSAQMPLPDLTQVLFIQVPDGETIRYEFTPAGTLRVAGNLSPSLSGNNMFVFGGGWVLSIIDAAALP